jgi:23S rRNA (uridine2479-2'-O)-methyltransferase
VLRTTTMRVTTRNASFQQWQALLGSRTKRHRSGEFLVHGVRQIGLAVEHGWRFRALLYPAGRPLSGWAVQTLERVAAQRVAMAPELLHELGDKSSGETPELLAVVELPDDDLARIALGPGALVLVFDRPATPGNIGTLIRSADAFGATGVIITGHAADPYDPKAVRASTGSLFALPVVRVPSHREVLAWRSAAAAAGTAGTAVTVIGTDEHGDVDVADLDYTGPTLVVIGNETRGMSEGWRGACDRVARIPITGAASSLNAAAAATVVLYEAARQRQG